MRYVDGKKGMSTRLGWATEWRGNVLGWKWVDCSMEDELWRLVEGIGEQMVDEGLSMLARGQRYNWGTYRSVGRVNNRKRDEGCVSVK